MHIFQHLADRDLGTAIVSKVRHTYSSMGFVFLLGVLFSMNSCVRVEPVTVPFFSSRLDSPELSGESGSIFVGGSLINNHKIIIVPNIVADPPDLENPQLDRRDRVPSPSGYIGLGFFERIELSFDIDRGLLLKSQIFGENRKKAVRGNFSAAISFGLNYANGGGSETTMNSSSDATLASYDWQLTSTYSNFLLGYRPRENILIYGGPYYATYSLAGNLEQYAYRSIILRDQEFEFSNDGSQLGIGFAFEFIFDAVIAKQALIYSLEIGKTNWNNFTSETLLNHGFMIKYYF